MLLSMLDGGNQQTIMMFCNKDNHISFWEVNQIDFENNENRFAAEVTQLGHRNIQAGKQADLVTFDDEA